MIKKLVPGLLLAGVLLAGCTSRSSDHDGARLPAARPESLTTASGELIQPGRISQIVHLHLHTDGRVTLEAEFAGTDHFKKWMNEEGDLLAEAMGGDVVRIDDGAQARFVRQIEYDSIAEVNETGAMELEVVRTPLYYTLNWTTKTASYSPDSLAQVFTQPESGPVTAEAWGSYLLDAYHLRFEVTDERTGAQYAWERSAREIGAGQTVSFIDKAWRPLAWIILGAAGALLAFVTWAGLVGERLWAPRAEVS